ncbi:adenosylcobinamide-GDP ribazoletransferase [Pseudomonas sp. HR96]|uniref:adenosylcobinamide-GDP ribazoletransferase n=1 Tax=Pseudomonas sp. HR96 TaxID=1027966 RepID=UPI002A748026|nr:adenosylcobinamide-GDP ribazoletransferase [Pseudomonas sp. HR96]WPO98949.1 adenosylcobinamide-GDP ribazoletransferase [Pseudomonas sp. HR96]
MAPLLIALQFLSRLPVRLPGMPAPQAVGRSLLFYPLVGLLLGLLLCLGQWLLQGAPPLLQAALLLAGWVLFSGALHLDGLADSADAWLGGFGDRERTLLIMKDPRSGPIAVVTLVVVLLLKFCALAAVLQLHAWPALLLTPVLGRAVLLGLFLTTAYIRAGGLGQALADHLPRRQGWWVLGLVALGCVLIAPGHGLASVLVAVLVVTWLRRLMIRRLGGTTGDTAGAVLEIVEMAVLVVWAL